MAYCNNCGKKLLDNARFCTECGAEQPKNLYGTAVPQVTADPQASNWSKDNVKTYRYPAQETIQQPESRIPQYGQYQEPACPMSPKKKKSKALVILGIVLGVSAVLITGLAICLFLGFPLKFGNTTIHVENSLLNQIEQVELNGSGMEIFSCEEMTMMIPNGMEDATEEFGASLDCDFIMRSEGLSILGKRYDRGIYQEETAEDLIEAMYNVQSVNDVLENVEILDLKGKPYHCLRTEQTNGFGQRVYHYNLAMASKDALWEISINSFGSDYPDWVKIADSIKFD